MRSIAIRHTLHSSGVYIQAYTYMSHLLAHARQHRRLSLVADHDQKAASNGEVHSSFDSIFLDHESY